MARCRFCKDDSLVWTQPDGHWRLVARGTTDRHLCEIGTVYYRLRSLSNRSTLNNQTDRQYVTDAISAIERAIAAPAYLGYRTIREMFPMIPEGSYFDTIPQLVDFALRVSISSATPVNNNASPPLRIMGVDVPAARQSLAGGVIGPVGDPGPVDVEPLTSQSTSFASGPINLGLTSIGASLGSLNRIRRVNFTDEEDEDELPRRAVDTPVQPIMVTGFATATSTTLQPIRNYYFRGLWQASDTYNVNDVISYHGTLYMIKNGGPCQGVRPGSGRWCQLTHADEVVFIPMLHQIIVPLTPLVPEEQQRQRAIRV